MNDMYGAAAGAPAALPAPRRQPARRRRSRLRTGLVALAAIAAGLPPLGAVAGATTVPTVTVPDVTASPGVATPVAVSVSGFDGLSQVDATLSLPSDGGKVSIDTTGLSSLTLDYGSSSFSGGNVAFHGSLADVTAALGQHLTWTPGSDTSETLSASVTEYAGDGTFYNSTNGHYYQVVSSSSSIAFADARSAAKAKTLLGMQGYLATITSQAENDFVSNNVDGKNIWIGASDLGSVTGHTTGDWYWLDGPEAGTEFWTGTSTSSHGAAVASQYASWQTTTPAQPDMYNNNEFYADTNNMGTRGNWNDLAGNERQATSYLVEYGGMPGDSNAVPEAWDVGTLRVAASLTQLTTEGFTGTALGRPSDWRAGGTGTKPCLTAGTATSDTPVPGCASTAIDPAGSGALRLTPAANNTVGYVLYDYALPTSGGLDITFDQAQYGGSGADGISLFVVDGTTALSAPGQFGGYLGYGAGGTGSPTGGQGVVNGLFNVGLDAFGNNGTNAYNGGGCSAASPYSTSSDDPNNVVLRGSGNGGTGYCYLNSSKQNGKAVTLHSSANTTRTAATHLVRVVVDPASAVTHNVTVYVDGVQVAQAAQPAAYQSAHTFKFGFAASTGGSNDVHELWNLDVKSVTAVAPALGVTVGTPDRQPPAPGTDSTLVYNVTTGNTGGPEASPITVTHALPAGTTVKAAPTGTNWDCSATTVGSGTVSCTYTPDVSNPLRPGSALPAITVPVTVPADANPATTLTTGLTVADANGNSAAGKAAGGQSLTVTPEADLVATLTAPTDVPYGETISYQLAMTNNGPSAATNAKLTGTIPTGVTNVAFDNSACAITTSPQFACTVESLASGQSLTATMTGTAPTAVAPPADVPTALQIHASSATADPALDNNSSATATTQAEDRADLGVTLDQPAAMAANGAVTETFTVTNHGPNSADAPGLSASLGSLVGPTTSTAGCTITGSSLQCRWTGQLAVGATQVATVTGTAPATTQSPIVTNATIGAGSVDPNSTNDSTGNVQTVVSPDLQVGVTGPDRVALGGAVTYTVTVHNPSATDATGLTLSDTLPADLTNVSVTSSGEFACDPTMACASGTVVAGGTATITISGTAPAAPETMTEQASVTDGSSVTASSQTISTTVERRADLSATATTAGAVAIGGTMPLHVTAHNAGPNTATGVQVVLPLPSGMSVVSSTLPADCLPNGATVTCTAGSDLAVGDTVSWDLQLTSATEGSVTIQPYAQSATTAAVDPDGSNDITTPLAAVVQREADLGVTVDGPTQAALGELLTHLVTLHNYGPNDVRSVSLTDAVTGAASVVSPDGACSAGTSVVCGPFDLAVGAEATFAVQSTAPATAGVIHHDATYTTDPKEPFVDLAAYDNEATSSVTVGDQADVAVTLTAVPTATAGDSVDYTIGVVNNGPNTAANVAVTVPVPDGLTSVTATAPCTFAAAAVTCPVGDLANGATWSGTFRGTAGTAGTLSLTAAATTDTVDVQPANNTSAPAATVVAPAPPAPATPGAPPAPAGALHSGSSTSTTDDGKAATSAGPLAGTATGPGAMTVSQLGAVPAVAASGATTGDYYRVAMSTDSTFHSLQLRVSDPTARALFWYNGSQWQKVQGTVREQATGDLVATIGADTRPSLAQAGDLQLAVGATPSDRLGGADRIATAVRVSASAYPTRGSAKAAVLARDDIYADALTGGPLAAAENAPLLLSQPGALSQAVASELTRVLPKGSTVYLLGGTGALAPGVATAVGHLGFHVVRIWGANRYDTAVQIAQALGNPSTVLEATGLDFPDAMSAGPAAVSVKGAVLLTSGAQQSAATAAYLKAHHATRYAVGGAAASADHTATAFVGSDRNATSALVAERFFPKPAGMGVAAGDEFPDSLVAAPYLGRTDQPLLLATATGPLPQPISGYLSARSTGIGQVTVFGGTGVFPATSLDAVEKALP